jgi:hypothetical protein
MAGAMGLVAYPGQGIAKSIRTAVKSKTRHMIQEAKHSEGEYLSRLAKENGVNHERLLTDFESLMKKDS